MTALSVQNLSVRRGSRAVLEDVSFTVDQGELVGVLGPNGVGKSTLFDAILGLIPASGTIKVMGQPLDGADQQFGQAVALIPQERDVAWPMSVESIVALGRLPHLSRFDRLSPTDRKAIDHAMSAVDVAHLSHRRVTELSGGERSRALIARALAQETPLLFADEPTNGLDPAHQISVLDLFRRQTATGQTVILTIHELHLAARWCDRIILLHENRIAADGPPVDVLTEARIEAVYGCNAHIWEDDGELLVVPKRTKPHIGGVQNQGLAAQQGGE
ncbi:MAG: ABC transporter ATP-binding protein [Pseudomonadota bacterium]